MKQLLTAALLAVGLAAQAQVHGDIQIGIPFPRHYQEPAPIVYGDYGAVDVTGLQPVLAPSDGLYPIPVTAIRGYAAYPPIFMHVPLEHRQRWRWFCRAYGDACYRPVYFVDDVWFSTFFIDRAHRRPIDNWGWDHRDWNHRDHRGWDRHDWDHRDNGDRGGDQHDQQHNQQHDQHDGEHH